MKLNEAILQAANEVDPSRRRERIEQCVFQMRYRLGWTAAQCEKAAEKSGVDRDRWNELLCEVDNPIG